MKMKPEYVERLNADTALIEAYLEHCFVYPGEPQQTLPVVLEGLRQLLACAISGRVFHDFEVSKFRGFEVW